MPTLPLSYIELSKKNLEHNLKALRALAKPGTKIAFPVKGNAYGHGLVEIVKASEKLVDYFLVNSIEELRLLRSVSKKQTLLFGYVHPAFLGEAMQLGCIFGLFSVDQAQQIEKAAKKLSVTAEVHIACDALLGREGFLETEFADGLAFIQKQKHIRVTGMYAHFANIEDTNDFSHAQEQIDAYERMKSVARDSGCAGIDTHISATSGLVAYESKTGVNTIVRTGIGAYGLWPSEDLKKAYGKKLELKPVLSWKTHIAQVKTLAKGMTVGYGLTYVTTKLTKVALIPQGYSDGFPRTLSSKGTVLIGGKKCTVIGRVAMNMFVADVSKVPDAKEGDEVVLLGSQDTMSLSAEGFAADMGTINYEAVTRISPLLPRILK